MRKVVLIILVLLVSTTPSLAQTATLTPTPRPPTPTGRPQTVVPRECGNGLPCGALPWLLPSLPRLLSPTPFPTVLYTAVPTNTPSSGATPLPTAAPLPTVTLRPTDDFDVGEIENRVATLEALVGSTQVPISLNGTPFDFTAGSSEIGTNAGTLFGYIRGVTSMSFGVMQPIITFVFFGGAFILVVKSTQLILPIVSVIFGFLRKIVQLVLDFIPG